MPILNTQVSQVGTVGTLPKIIYIETNDMLAEVTSVGYLNGLEKENLPISDGDMALVSTKTSPNALSTQTSWFSVSKSGQNFSLVPPAGPGNISLPTVSGHLAVYTNTLGTLGEDASTAINAGNLQAGISGTSGYLASFPVAANSGSLRLSAAANSGNTVTTITNVAMGQASTISIPDPANAAGILLAAATNTPFTSGHFAMASGTSGLMVDSGLAVANIQNKTLIKANTINVGGNGAGPFSVTIGGVTSAAIVCATVASSTNAGVSVLQAISQSGGISLLLSADPGVSCILNYIIFLASQ